MKNENLKGILEELPEDIKILTRLSVLISRRIEVLMHERGLSKKQFADALGKRPSEVTKWLSGNHNFTISTLAMLSAFFNKDIVEISSSEEMKSEPK